MYGGSWFMNTTQYPEFQILAHAGIVCMYFEFPETMYEATLLYVRPCATPLQVDECKRFVMPSVYTYSLTACG